MGDKPATAIPGIGKASSQRLGQQGIHEASAVNVHFNHLNQDQAQFKNWLDDSCRANNRNAGAAGDSLKEWNGQFGSK